MDYLESNKKVKKLPALFPNLLYNGENKWTAPINILDLIAAGARLGRFALNFEYFKIAENAYRKEEWLRIKNIVSTLFLAESYYDIELLQQELLALFEREPDREAVSLLLNWFKQLWEHGRIEKADYKSLEKIYTDKEEVRSMLINTLESERKKIYKKGKLEGKIEAAKNLLAEGLSVSFISKVTGLSEAEILKLQSEV